MANDFDLGPPFALVGVLAVIVLALLGFPALSLLPCALPPVFLYFIGRWRSRGNNYASTVGLIALVSWFYGAFVLAPALVRGSICGGDLVETACAGTLLGVVVLVPLFVLLFPLMEAAKRVRVARPGSLAAVAEHRFIWAAGLLPLAWITGGIALAGAYFDPSSTTTYVFVALAAIGVQLAFIVADGLTLHRIARYANFGHTLSSTATLEHAIRVDLGVGDDLHGDLATEGTYRESPRAGRVVLGDVARSAAAIRACMRVYLQSLAAAYAVAIVITLLAVTANGFHLHL